MIKPCCVKIPSSRNTDRLSAYAVHSAPAPVHPSVAPSVPTPVPAPRVTSASKDPKTIELPATSFPVVSPPARSSISTPHAVDPVYAVKTPPVRQPMVPPVVSPAKPSVIVTSTALPAAKPSVPAQDAYAVKEAPVHTAATVDPVHTVPAPAPAPAKPSVPAPKDGYAVEKAPVEKAPLVSASAVDAVHASPSDAPAPHAELKAEEKEGEQCAQECDVKCQTANIAFDVTQCRSSCLAECHGGEKSSAHGTAGRYTDAATAAAAIPGTQGKSKAGHGLSLDHEAVSYEECIESCKGNWQTAGIAFDVSQGEYDCASACRHYASEETKIILKKAAPTVPKMRLPVALPKELSSETVDYESCMHSCKGDWQSADMALEISQGEYDCKSRCAKYASDDKKIVLKKDTLPSLPASSFRLPPPPPTELSSETVDYESCMSSCKGNWQSADMALEISQGEYDCKSHCTQYASDDKKIVVKKATTPPASLPASSFRLPKPDLKMSSSEVTFESCMRSCKGRWQTAGIAFDVSQGDYDCKSKCTKYASEDDELIVSRDTLPLPAHEEDLATAPPPAPTFDKGFTAWEACMHGCSGRYQDADIALDLSQGDYDCDSKCARYNSEHTTVNNPRQLVGDSLLGGVLR
ncbi:hypothetical protein F5Y14DRAFT_195951 [Nemania sp. NC0429]|nr:hypothetical protein F5Y14DRAFT_195951 [Nemania sp. NC0429]